MLKKITSGLTRVKETLSKPLKKVKKTVANRVKKRPFSSFFIALGTLLVLIIASNILGTPKAQVKKETKPIKPVHVYRVGSGSRLSVQAQVKKSGVVRITALTGGVVQQIYRTEGERFYRGNTLVYISTNYQGGNAGALQTKLAQLQLANTVDTFTQQKDLIQKQRDLASEVNKKGGENDLTKTQKDVTNMQLDLQEKALNLTLNSQETQVQLAQIQEAMAYPSAPFNGTVQKVSVKIGQAVNPGQELMILSENIDEDPVTATAYVSAEVASSISSTQTSILRLRGKTLESKPVYVSQDAVQGDLYAVYYDIPDMYRSRVTEGGFITVDLPIGEADTTALTPYIPIDSVYQTKDSSYLFVASKGTAVSRTVQLGSVYGNYVEVLGGLKDGDAIIVDRSVISGDSVKIVER